MRFLQWITLCTLLLVGCAHCPISAPCVFGVQPSEKIEKMLKENPLGPKENFKIIPLGRDKQSSYHLVQIRDKERLHRHNTHDGAVLIWEGKGELLLGGKVIKLKKGDEIKIPKGVEHSFTNENNGPTIAVVQFTPPFDGKDTEYLEK